MYVASFLDDTIRKLTVGEQQLETTPQPSSVVDPKPSAVVAPSSVAATVPATTTFVSDPVFLVPFTLELPPRWSQYEGSEQTSRGLIDMMLTQGRLTARRPTSPIILPINAFLRSVQRQPMVPCHRRWARPWTT